MKGDHKPAPTDRQVNDRRADLMYADRDWGASGRILTVVGFAVLMATLTVVNIGDSGVLT